MSAPNFIYNSPDDTVPHDYKTRDVSDENIRAIQSIYTIINDHADELHEQISLSIQQYMSRYGVEADGGVDQFKLVYFSGRELASLLVNQANDYGARVVQYATVIMLEYCLKRQTGGDGRRRLRTRLKDLIKAGHLETRLGPDGMYLIYKVAANMLNDHNDKHTNMFTCVPNSKNYPKKR